ncbi:flagellar protein FlaG [Psychrosphaera sp. B3R10]|uniref:flagellar protein FlaG n=1 Tax=unclassified Psychrosphaera TaxID=2641570 RepID=UPI001C0828CD|nr:MULTISPECIES: flagellar protein FlaG [unclassified Psychrosphaera]MBU2884062.1 flagellar protein FlaG [Psychrosphaera sp. I2R16]MBU2988192.1 flagellar protein FlaG [Psychrosphaera sp. B3R10]
MNTLNPIGHTETSAVTKSNVPDVLNKTDENELVVAVDKNSGAAPQTDVYIKQQIGHDQNDQNTQQETAETVESDLSKEQMTNMAQSLQSFVESLNRSIEFSVDDEANRNVITVKDSLSGDVIRQIPSQEVLDLIKSLGKTTGILFNEDV